MKPQKVIDSIDIRPVPPPRNSEFQDPPNTGAHPFPSFPLAFLFSRLGEATLDEGVDLLGHFGLMHGAEGFKAGVVILGDIHGQTLSWARGW